MTPSDQESDQESDQDIEAAEAWFLGHGLPWFVEPEHERVSALLHRRRVLRVAAVSAVVGVALGAPVGWWTGAPSNAVAVAATAVGAGLLGWALVRLRAGVVARWAAARLLGQLGLLVPLVTRALPLLLIFTVFFFINTEVWQVASSLTPGVLWLSVLLFAAVALAFLVARLPEEVDRVVGEVDDTADGQRLVRACAGTPLAERARALATGPPSSPSSPSSSSSSSSPSSSASPSPVGDLRVPLSRLQRLNLLLVLLVVQAGQVLLLAVAVFAFFTLFGVVAIEPEIVETWVGSPPVPVGWSGSPLSLELLQVAVFLAAFSGLYFTVSAVTDASYREQFFTHITTELERAVGVRTVYAALLSGRG